MERNFLKGCLEEDRDTPSWYGSFHTETFLDTNLVSKNCLLHLPEHFASIDTERGGCVVCDCLHVSWLLSMSGSHGVVVGQVEQAGAMEETCSFSK